MELVRERGSLVDQAKASNDLGLIVHFARGDTAAVIRNLEESIRLFQKDAALRKDTPPIQAFVSVYNNLGFIALE